MDDFDVNHDDSIEFEEFMLVISAYSIIYSVILFNPSVRNGSSKSFKLWTMIAMDW